MATTITCSDIDLTFNINPIKKDLILSINEKAISRSVRNLVLTNHYERPFHPEIGSNATKMLFEPITTVLENYLETEIFNVIKNFEPRVNLISVDVIVQRDGYEATIKYYIINQVQQYSTIVNIEKLR